MVYIPSLLLLALSASAAPTLNKRIAQVISDSTKKWEAACDAAGGGQQCNTIAVNSFGTLLAAAGPCDQQNAADNMIDLAKQLNNNADMIKFAQLFAQQPRNSPSSEMVPYCQQAPKNAELNGVFQCQFQSTSATNFVGGVAVGGPGTIPFGHTQPISPRGSCPANPGGPVPDGQQLTDITSDPGNVGSAAGNNAGGAPPAAKATAPAKASSAPAPSATASDGGDHGCDDSGDDVPASPTATPAAANNAAASAAVAPASTSAAASGSFQLQNGKDAQKLNASFKGLKATDSCTDGQQACIDQDGASAFALCANGSWVLTKCAGGLQCFALPLVAKPGTSVTCDTQDNALSRIADTGATGGLDGSS